MVEYMGRDRTKLNYGIGTDITDFDNNQVKLAVAELQALDNWLGGYIHEAVPVNENFPATPASYYPSRIPAGRDLAWISGDFHFQTAILAYLTGAICTTAEGTPNTHTMALTNANLSTTPVNAAFHFEKETSGGNIEWRTDFMGMVMPSLTISCSEGKGRTTATQRFRSNFCYTLATADDLAITASLAEATYPPYTWFDLQNGGITFTYGGTPLALSVVSVEIILGWSSFEADIYDSNGYPTDGRNLPPFINRVRLGFRPYDHATNKDIKTIKDESLSGGAYASDLDLTLDFKKSATHYCKFTYDKLYMDPTSWDVQVQGQGDWFDGYIATFDILSDSGSLTIEEKNGLNNDYYENP